MRIIRPGYKHKLYATCGYCKCEFEFYPSEVEDIWDDGGYVKCPDCGQTVESTSFYTKKETN